MFANLSGWHLLIILAVVLLLFGATRLPALSRSVGQSVRIFRSETKHLKDESDNAPAETEPGASLAGMPASPHAPVVPQASRTGV